MQKLLYTIIIQTSNYYSINRFSFSNIFINKSLHNTFKYNEIISNKPNYCLY